MKSSAIRKPFITILIAILYVSLAPPTVTAADKTRASEPHRESSTLSRESDDPNARPDTSNQQSPQPLSEDEVAEISARAEDPGQEVAGGALSNLHLTYIVIALAAAVIVLVLK